MGHPVGVAEEVALLLKRVRLNLGKLVKTPLLLGGDCRGDAGVVGCWNTQKREKLFFGLASPLHYITWVFFSL